MISAEQAVRIVNAEKFRPKSPLQKAREIAYAYVPNGEPLKKEQEQAAVTILRNRMGFYAERLCQKFLDNILPLSEQQQNRINEFYRLMKEKNLHPKILKQLKNIKTEGELNFYIMKFQNLISKYEFNPICEEARKNCKGKGVLLEYEQLIYKKRCMVDDCIRSLYIMFAKPSSNPEVIKIESLLKEEYGVETALLNNDIVIARNILSVVKKYKENNIPIPNEYIVTDFEIGGSCLRSHNGQKTTILLNSSQTKTDIVKIKELDYQCAPVKREQILIEEWKKQCGFKNSTSSSAFEHVEAHEGIHGTHPFLFAFMFQKLGNKFSKTIKKISGYCAIKPNCIHEIYAELKTKSLYQSLEKDEEKLLNLLEGKKA